MYAEHLLDHCTQVAAQYLRHARVPTEGPVYGHHDPGMALQGPQRRIGPLLHQPGYRGSGAKQAERHTQDGDPL